VKERNDPQRSFPFFAHSEIALRALFPIVRHLPLRLPAVSSAFAFDASIGALANILCNDPAK